MTLIQLNQELTDLGISQNRYYIHGLYGSSNDESKLGLQISRVMYTRKYEICYKERGEKRSIRTFIDENEACQYFLHQIQEELTIEKTKKVVGLSDMGITERLLATGLRDEFDKVKKENKNRAAQILRILEVDEPSMQKILN